VISEPLWAPITGFEGTYEVSNHGQVRRIAPGPRTHPGKLLKGRPYRKGYLRVVLHAAGSIREATLHRLVAEAFLPPPARPDQVQINHIDGDKTNNRADNLEWCTGSENMRHSHAIGLRAGSHAGVRILVGRYMCRRAVRWSKASERNGRAKLTRLQVDEIRASSELHRVLAARYGVSKSLIGQIRAGTCWRDWAAIAAELTGKETA
jgi:hypothetical protein